LRHYGIEDEVHAALPTVDAAYEELGWDHYREGGATLSSLHLGEQWRLALVAGHYGHVIERDVRKWNKSFPVAEDS